MTVQNTNGKFAYNTEHKLTSTHSQSNTHTQTRTQQQQQQQRKRIIIQYELTYNIH